MPGTPDPIFGSDPLTLVVAVTLSVLVIGGFAYADWRFELSTVSLVGVGAAGYGLFAVGLWAGVRVVFYHLSPMTEPFQFVLLILLAGGLLAVQATIPFYLFARFGFVLPMVAFTAISTFLLFVFLRVGGETDPIALFGFGFAPFFIGSLLGLAVVEATIRYVVSTSSAIETGTR